MRRLSIFFLLILCAFLASGCVVVSTSGDYTLERGETLRSNLVVTSGRARLEQESRVTGSVFMTSGSLDVGAEAEVEGDVFMTSGDLNLGPRAVVRGDVILTSGQVRRAESARVGGKISSNGFDVGASLFGAFCVPPVVLLAVFLYWLIDRGRRRRVAEAPGSPTALVAGVVLILVGGLILVDNWADIDLHWWALFILIPALNSLGNAWRIARAEGRLSAAARGSLVSGAALLLVTVIFLFGLSWVALWPLFVIILGVGLLIAR